MIRFMVIHRYASNQIYNFLRALIYHAAQIKLSSSLVFDRNQRYVFKSISSWYYFLDTNFVSVKPNKNYEYSNILKADE